MPPPISPPNSFSASYYAPVEGTGRGTAGPSRRTPAVPSPPIPASADTISQVQPQSRNFIPSEMGERRQGPSGVESEAVSSLTENWASTGVIVEGAEIRGSLGRVERYTEALVESIRRNRSELRTPEIMSLLWQLVVSLQEHKNATWAQDAFKLFAEDFSAARKMRDTQGRGPFSAEIECAIGNLIPGRLLYDLER